VTGIRFGGGARKFLLIAVPLFQFVLYSALTVIGDIQVKAHDEHIDDLAKHGVGFDWGNSTPTCHEISFGLNLPMLIASTLVTGAVATLARGDVRSFLDWDHSVPIQVISGALVPFFWFVVVRCACITAERLNSRAFRARIVKLFGLLVTILAVWSSLWLWWHNNSEDWLLRAFPVCWVLFGIFSLTAIILRPRAVATIATPRVREGQPPPT
jgi:hypothetical protein